MKPDTSTNDIAWFERGPSGPGSIVAAGKIQMLGLDPIKVRLGPKWERMSEHVHRYFEAAIRQEMRPGDTFYNFGPSTYLLLFRDLSVAEAQLKCRVIAEGVCGKLFGEDEDVSVRSLTLPVDGHDLSLSSERTRLSDLLEREGNITTFRQNGHEDESEKCITVSFTGHSRETHNLPLVKTNFLYRPLWDTARGAILTYICQPLPLSMSGSSEVTGMCVATGSAPEGEESEQLQLDMILLRECAKRSAVMRSTGRRALLLAPLHLTTLSRPRLWKQYSELRKSLSAASIADIGFMVHGIGPEIPNIRLTMELPRLSVLSRHVYCLTDDPQGVCQQFRNTGTRAVGIAVAKNKSESHSAIQLENLGREARSGGFDAFALGVGGRSLAVNAIGFGMRWLEGRAVSPRVAEPKFSFVQRIEALYRQELAKAVEFRTGDWRDVG